MVIRPHRAIWPCDLLATILLTFPVYKVNDGDVPSCTTPCALVPDNFFKFFTWHFLESIPLFRVNETLQLKEPLVYRGAAAGWLVVAFKVAMILPLIGAVRSYWTLRSDQPALRIDAWPRIVHKGQVVNIKWAPSEPPAGYVFDTWPRRSGRSH